LKELEPAARTMRMQIEIPKTAEREQETVGAV